ncbi:hypothetical protein M419DRAFT_90942 [Trichoderma reesei RUT C-30]|uniref:Uncharacterized protein n=1 Tax=Hypocrea jecorina (strain ATCC 56765 / BCRC 32924 / NRRL 11460 / Rut C-30) TaxID=1344414 RepID=A0A024RZW8_HYPJR|nr:hypothetical protein M419DRAFT_90942 [Trichoderma reesei RUT C-30]
MRDQISPNGKVYRFKPYHKWDDWTQRHCHVPKAVRNHMVVVIRKSPINNDNWRVATITTTVSPGIDERLFVPIAPMPQDPVTHMQLHLADDPYGDMGLPRPSYLRVSSIYEVPHKALVEQRSYYRNL